MRKTILILALVASGCATSTPPQVQPQQQCNPGHALLNATVWVQSSAEYRAAVLGTWTSARRALDAALADPSWNVEEGTSDPAQPPAIILDADETVIDNASYEARVIKAGKSYDAETWKQWVSESAARAVPGAAEFLAWAKSRGVTPFYITNRDHPEEAEGTLRNLQNLGYPLDPNVDTLLLRGERPEWKSDKGSRRAHVASSYRVLLLFGDDLNDFANARDKSAAEREEIVRSNASRWGTQWFMIPNPMYGSWERAITAGTGTPCEQVQKKVDSLRP
ncbi:MAG TPA: HAD family acid phosphatase [Thermoanaerobaculia bacterium]|nr:HAD family acid phosphatase [Thermoanaerobaculia bacterium]